MRTIKFRAWDKITEQMCEVWEIGFQHWHRTPGLNFVNIQADGKEERLPDEIELMQFTGLLDKNGKEIYEGDIVIAPWHWKTPHQIKFPEDYYAFEEYQISEDMTVIGNVYENPELIGARL